MSMRLAFYTVSDNTIDKILTEPPLVFRLVAPDDPEIYIERVSEKNKPSFIKRLFGIRSQQKEVPDIPSLDLEKGEGVCVGLDKAWHGIHYLLTKTNWGGEPPLNFLVTGGKEFSEIEIGWCPPRLFTSNQVKSIHEALSKIDHELLRSRFDPNDMMEKDIYPNIWDRDPKEDDTLGYCLDYFNTLKDFISRTSERNLGMLIVID